MSSYNHDPLFARLGVSIAFPVVNLAEQHSRLQTELLEAIFSGTNLEAAYRRVKPRPQAGMANECLADEGLIDQLKTDCVAHRSVWLRSRTAHGFESGGLQSPSLLDSAFCFQPPMTPMNTDKRTYLTTRLHCSSKFNHQAILEELFMKTIINTVVHPYFTIDEYVLSIFKIQSFQLNLHGIFDALFPENRILKFSAPQKRHCLFARLAGQEKY